MGKPLVRFGCRQRRRFSLGSHDGHAGARAFRVALRSILSERSQKFVEDVRAHKPLGVLPTVNQRYLRNGCLDALVEGGQIQDVPSTVGAAPYADAVGVYLGPMRDPRYSVLVVLVLLGGDQAPARLALRVAKVAVVDDQYHEPRSLERPGPGRPRP